MKKLILLLFFLPCALQAQIFRCEAKGDTYYSQIPCSDSSEAVVIEDRPMFSETAQNTEAQPEEQLNTAAPVRSQADNLQEFVSTLRRQRTDQLEQLDQDIGKLEAQLSVIGDSPSDASQREAIGEQLAEIRTSRSSIVEQYESMIMEAERRVAALTATEPSVGDKTD